MTSAKSKLEELFRALRESWGPDTCFRADDWDTDNPARGQCVSSSLVLQDYLGGDLLRFEVDAGAFTEKHYSNRLNDGTVIDATYQQYKMPVSLRYDPVALKTYPSVREKRLAEASTRSKYEILKRRVAQKLESQ